MPKRKLSQRSRITKKLKKESPVKEEIQSDQTDSDELNLHVLELIATKIGTNPNILRFSSINSQCQTIAERQISRCRGGITVDLEDFNQSKAILDSQWYSTEDKSHLKFHKNVREMIAILSQFFEKYPTNRNILKGFSPEAMGWLTGVGESTPKRCPQLLQKKILKLFKNHFKRTTEFQYQKALLRPTRFVRLFKFRLDTVTKLDLGEMKSLKRVGLRTRIFPKLVNLRELVWHAAEMWFVEALPHPHKLESLCFTLILKGIHGDVLRALMNCQSLKQLHTGIHRPPMNRLVWTVVLKSYQAFWNQKQYNPEDILVDKGIEPVPLKNQFDDCDFTYHAFPKLEKISFWDAPEYLFVTMAKERLAYKELQLGLLTQDLQSLCSLDSIMQAFFKYMQPENLLPLNVDHLKIYAHSMPVVSLDYYLPYLMDALGQCLPGLETIDLFVHCLISTQSMPTSWLRGDKRPRNPRSKFDNLTKFNFHIDGFCVLTNLDTYLPDTLQSISLSFIQPAENRKKFVASLLEFIKYLGDINQFPDLDELHIQVWGVACFEPIANAVIDHLLSLKRLSIITHPSNKKIETTLELIGRLVEKSPKLEEFALSDMMVKQLTAGENTKDHWRNVLFNLGERCGIEKECSLTIRRLPELNNWNGYAVAPPQFEENDDKLEDEDPEEEEEEIDSDCEEEEDSFIVGDDEGISEVWSEDEIDLAEKALECEDEKDYRRWQKRARIESECSERSDENDVLVFRRKRTGETSEEEEDEESEQRNPFLDDEAEEKNNESEVEDETEPEGEDIVQSDDEELFDNQLQLVNMRLRRHPVQQKRRRIIESDSD